MVSPDLTMITMITKKMITIIIIILMITMIMIHGAPRDCHDPGRAHAGAQKRRRARGEPLV